MSRTIIVLNCRGCPYRKIGTWCALTEKDVGGCLDRIPKSCRLKPTLEDYE